MSEWLDPFRHEFMLEAFLVGSVIATVCAVLSCFLVLKGWSLMGDAISHAVLPGIVLAYAAGIPLSLGAFASGLLCAVGTGFIKRNSRVKEDTVMGVVFTGLFAIGLVLFSRTPSDLHLDHILFGNILGIPPRQVIETIFLSLAVLAVMIGLRRDLMLLCFDPSHAHVVALHPKRLNYLLLALLSIVVVVSLKAVGIILVVAMLVTPGAIAYLLSDSFGRMLGIAVGSAVLSTCCGIYVSFFLNGSTGACIVLSQALVFTVVMSAAPKHGLWAKRRRGRAGAAPAGGGRSQREGSRA